MRIYNVSKSIREDLTDYLAKTFPRAPPLKTKDLKVAEGSDPTASIVFDESESLYLGSPQSKKKGDTKSQVYFPLLKDKWLLPSLPIITVDAGAIKFVVNGANVMRPGIKAFEGEFAAGDIVVVKEEKFGKAIAIGRTKLSRPEMEATEKGAVIENLHYVGDKFWDMMKEIP